MSAPTNIPAFAFHEAHDGTITWGGSWEPAHYSASGEPVAVEYTQTESGLWVPHQAWVRDSKGGIDMYDCDFIESRGELYYHESGGGTPYVNGWMEPERLPGRIWIAEGAVVTCDGRSKRPLSDADLLARGIRRVHGPTPAPFDDAIEGDVLWCEDCKDYVPHEDGEGITACGRCSEQHHVHADGLIVAVDLDFDPAVYRVKGLWAPYEIECGYLGEDDVERVADIPADMRIASGDDAASLCRDCAAQILADRVVRGCRGHA